MAMGLGVFVVEKFKISTTKLIWLLFFNGFIILLLANPGIFSLIFLNEYLFFIFRKDGTDLLFSIYFFGIILTVLIGMIAGAELPIFSKILEQKSHSDFAQTTMTQVLFTDYFGAFIGTFAFVFLLFPLLGLLSSLVLCQFLLIIVLNIFIFWVFGKDCLKSNIMPWLLLLNSYILMSFLLRHKLSEYLTSMSFWI